MDLDQRKEYFNEEILEVSETEKHFEELEFEDCVFKKCNFITCIFTRCKFVGCRFENCVLSAVSFNNSRLIDVSFKNSKVIGIDWGKADLLRSINFIDSTLNYSSFRMLKLPKIKMENCEAKEVEFIESDLSLGSFQGTDFTKAIFSKTNLNGANFTEAKNYYIDVTNNKVRKAHFSLPEALNLLSSFEVIIE